MTDAAARPPVPSQPMAGPPAAPPPQSPPQHRPYPRLPGLVSVVGGVLVIDGFILLIAKLPHGSQRPWSIVVSIALEAAAVAAMWFFRRRPANAGAVAVTLLAILPAWFFLVVDTHASQPIHSTSDLKSKTAVILVLAVAGWLALFFFAPVRRQTVFLGAALVALVLLAVIEIAVSTAAPANFDYAPATPTTTVTRVHPAASHQDGDDADSGDSFDYSDDYSDDYGYSDDTGGSGDFGYADRYSETISPFGFFGVMFAPGKFAVVLVVLGAAYLGVGALVDKARQSRVATPAFAVGLPTLAAGLVASGFTDFGLWGAAIVGLIAAVTVAWLGVRTSRRVTSWAAVYGMIAAISTMVVRVFSKSQVGAGSAFLVVGIAVLFAADQLTGRIDPFPHDDGRLPGRAGTPEAPVSPPPGPPPA